MNNVTSRDYYKLDGPVKQSEKMTQILKMLTVFDLSTVSRNCSNNYVCDKTNEIINRKETTAEHTLGAMKLADYFLINESEFSDIDRLNVFEVIMYHDDVEIAADDICISNRSARETKKHYEQEVLSVLAEDYPKGLEEKLLAMDTMYRDNKNVTSQFCHAIDKLHALVHELRYPEDWGQETGFIEENIRAWFEPALRFSPTFLQYFEEIIKFLKSNGYFE